MGTYRIVLADDHALFRQGLKGILEGAADLEVVGEAGDGLELLNLLNVDKLDPHLVILDISMPNVRGIEAIREIKTIHPNVKILIVTMHKDKEYLLQSLAAGADGYFLKKDSGTELFAAIEKIRNGRNYLSPQLSEELADDWDQIRVGFTKPLLTKREREVLKLIAQGKSNKDIADLLFVSVHTVERHRANMMEKLNLKKTADLVKYAIQRGYV
jgi:DNA-binding NarL/FixJ family response regulator